MVLFWPSQMGRFSQRVLKASGYTDGDGLVRRPNQQEEKIDENRRVLSRLETQVNDINNKLSELMAALKKEYKNYSSVL